MSDAFGHTQYLVRRKILKLLGGAFHIYAPDGSLALYSELKAFKLKEDIRLFADEAKTTEVVRISARSVIDFGATYDVFDGASNTKLGALRRKGLKSIVRDSWVILDANDQEIGSIAEDSMLLALVRRILSNLVPQTFQATVNGQPAATFRQNFNPFVLKITVTFTGEALDKRLGLAACVLLAAIEGRQN
ncbi:MAG TPA: hypothetical protein PKM88_03435 [bacterium]|nr:hypothetical protein [bacterium]